MKTLKKLHAKFVLVDQSFGQTHCLRVTGRNPTISIASCKRSKSCLRSSPSTVKQSCWCQREKQRLPALQTIKHHCTPQSEVCSWVVCYAIILFNYSVQKPDALPKCYSTSTHNKLIACCIQTQMHSNGQQSCFSGACVLPTLRRETVRVWLIDLKHHVIMKFGQKRKSGHIFLVENEGAGECQHMHVLRMQWKIQSDLPFTHTLEIWHTNNGKKSSNL